MIMHLHAQCLYDPIAMPTPPVWPVLAQAVFYLVMLAQEWSGDTSPLYRRRFLRLASSPLGCVASTLVPLGPQWVHQERLALYPGARSTPLSSLALCVLSSSSSVASALWVLSLSAKRRLPAIFSRAMVEEDISHGPIPSSHRKRDIKKKSLWGHSFIYAI